MTHYVSRQGCVREVRGSKVDSGADVTRGTAEMEQSLVTSCKENFSTRQTSSRLSHVQVAVTLAALRLATRRISVMFHTRWKLENADTSVCVTATLERLDSAISLVSTRSRYGKFFSITYIVR